MPTNRTAHAEYDSRRAVVGSKIPRDANNGFIENDTLPEMDLRSNRVWNWTRKFILGILWMLLLWTYPIHDIAAQNDADFIHVMAFNKDGTKLAESYNHDRVDVIDATSWRIVKTFQVRDVVHSIAWSPIDNNVLAIASSSSNSDELIRIINIDTEEILQQINQNSLVGDQSVTSVSWNSNGTRLAGGIDFVGDALPGRFILVWDPKTGKADKGIFFTDGAITQIDWNHTNNRLASGSTDWNAYILDTETGQTIKTLSGHQDIIDAVAWSPDGTKLATSGDYNDKTIRIWDVITGKTILTIQNYSAASLAWSPDGTRLAGAGYVDYLPVWDVATGQLLHTFTDKQITALAWSAQDKIAYSSATSPLTIVDAPQLSDETTLTPTP